MVVVEEDLEHPAAAPTAAKDTPTATFVAPRRSPPSSTNPSTIERNKEGDAVIDGSGGRGRGTRGVRPAAIGGVIDVSLPAPARRLLLPLVLLALLLLQLLLT